MDTITTVDIDCTMIDEVQADVIATIRNKEVVAAILIIGTMAGVTKIDVVEVAMVVMNGEEVTVSTVSVAIRTILEAHLIHLQGAMTGGEV